MIVASLLLQAALVAGPLSFAQDCEGSFGASRALSPPLVLAAQKKDCIALCEKGYFNCARKYGSDMKQCSDERKACVRRCERASSRS